MIEPIVPRYADGTEPQAFDWDVETGRIEVFDLFEDEVMVFRITEDGRIWEAL